MQILSYLFFFLVSTAVFSQQLYYTKAKQFQSTDFVTKSKNRIDHNGNKYIAGIFSGVTDFSLLSNSVNTTAVHQELFVVKYNSADSLLWVKQIKDLNNYGEVGLHVIDLEISSSGSVYLAYERAYSPIEPQNVLKDSIGYTVDNSHNVLKLDQSGNTIFNIEFEQYNENTILNLKDISLAPNDELFVTSLVSNTVELNPLGSPQQYTPYSSSDIVIAKYNSNGVFIRSRSIIDTVNSNIMNVNAASDNDGNLYLSAIMRGVAAFTQDSASKNIKVVGGDRTSGFLAKYNQALSLQFSNVIDPSNIEEFADIRAISVQKATGNPLFAITGNLQSSTDFDPSANTDILSPYLQSTTSYIAWYSKSTGNFVRSFRLGSPNTNTVFHNFDFIPNGDLIVAGQTNDTILDLDPTDSVYILQNVEKTNEFFIATYNSSNKRAIQGRPIVYGYAESSFFNSIAGTNSRVEFLAFSDEFSGYVLKEQLSGQPYTLLQNSNSNLFASYLSILPVNAVTNSSSNIQRVSANVSGSINNGEKDTILHRGFAFSFTNNAPLISNSDTVRVSGSYGSYTKTLQNLTPKRTYYFRSFVVTPSKVVYGVIDTFTTKFTVDTVKTLSGIINQPPTSISLEWNFEQEKLITRKFYIYRASDSTTLFSNFALVDSVSRDTTDILQKFTTSTLIGGNRYTFFVIAKADTFGPSSPFYFASLPAVPKLFTATKVLDTAKGISISFQLENSDSATQRCIVYVIKGTSADSAQMIPIDTIVRLNKQILFTKQYRTLFGKRIFDGTYTFRVRTLSKNVLSSPTAFQTVVFEPDSLKITSVPPDSACISRVYQHKILTSYTGIGALTYSLLGGPNGMSIDPVLGTILWTPNPTAAAVSNVSVVVRSEYNPSVEANLTYTVRKVDCTSPPEYNVACGLLKVNVVNSLGGLSTITALKVDENIQPDENITFTKSGTDTINLLLPKGLYQVSLLQENGVEHWYNAEFAFQSPDINIVCNDSVAINFVYTVLDTTPIQFIGVIRSTLNNDPIKGTVRFMPTTGIGQTLDIETDIAGVFTANVPRLGVYSVQATAIGFLPTFLDSSSNPLSGRLVGPFSDNSSGNIITMKPIPAPAVSVRGILLDENGNPQPGIVAAYRSPTGGIAAGRRQHIQFATVVGTDGHWTLDNLELGEYTIVAIPTTGFAYSKTHVGGFYSKTDDLLVQTWEEATVVPVYFSGVDLPSAIRFPLRTARPGVASFFGLLSRVVGLKAGETPLSTITDPGVIIMLSDQQNKPAGFGISNNQGLVGITGLSGGTYNGTASIPGLNSIDFIVEIDPKKKSDTIIISLTETESDPPTSVVDNISNTFSVSPNPVRSAMTITFENNSVSIVQIMDLSGKSIASIPIFSPQTKYLEVSTSNIPNGAYYVVTTSKYGTDSKLVIIQK